MSFFQPSICFRAIWILVICIAIYEKYSAAYIIGTLTMLISAVAYTVLVGGSVAVVL